MRPKAGTYVPDNSEWFEDHDDGYDRDDVDDAAELLHVGGTTAEDVARVRAGSLRAMDRGLL